ncbi:histidinol-phosphate transaminase [Jonesia denitrificans]|uniref:Histidinol-phosphate aminotransferase n=1 Tax=Jonesia denitrificans (strain ATCC 14870 / DSM 20603 / BCRC 15368 / CIP 55.134 / JCM 11481 / NBRC 15587 / NCTC 10816 / Prevot 55134) TaxID=471856 RepID=C7R3L2_JONDD|nr:histidinol-phosphate transaminase [Jonesia denitrificans]ACV08748.1 histidinol-phosphate aminotransferase [Jonesia denitrificans DSM 20603]SQH20737.1 Histidinol-phosphate aminotransferase [Jonesia denitrificans]
MTNENPATQPLTQRLALPLRVPLRGEHPYGAPQLDVAHLLNTNENPYSPPGEVIAAITDRVAQVAATLNRYPDRDFHELRHALAAYLSSDTGVDVAADNIWAANGSNEVMLHILQAFGGPGRTALAFAPTYAMYREYARNTATNYQEIPRNADFTIGLEDARAAIRTHQPSVIFLTSPNNPTGTAMPLSDVEAIAQEAQQLRIDGAPALVVVDEAYAEFRRTGTPSATELLSVYPHVIVTRTMSKAFALAGARVGYLAAHPDIVDALRIVRLPYHLSSVTQAVALAALDTADLLQEQVDTIRKNRDRLVDWLRTCTTQGRPLTVADSDSNFIFFGLFEDRDALWARLLHHGVLVRQSGPAGWLRVTIGTDSDIDAFTTALTKELDQ